MDQDETLPPEVERTVASVELMRDTYTALYSHMMEQIERVKRKEFDLRTLVDLGYLWREVERTSDDLRKEAKTKKELIGKIIAATKGKAFAADPSIDMLVRGRIASGSPDVKQVPGLPRPGSKQYQQLGLHLGITPEVLDRKLVKFNFTALSEMITELAESGRPPLPGVKAYPVFSTIYRKRG